MHHANSTAARPPAPANCRRKRWLAAPLALLLSSWLAIFLGAASPAGAADPVQVTIDATTSPLYMFAPNEDSIGYPGSYPTVDLSGVVTNCSQGIYIQEIDLAQDGHAATSAFGGLGMDEWSCNGTRPQAIGYDFYNPSYPLHSGAATATITLSRDGVVAATATQTVTIAESVPTAPASSSGGMTSTTSASLAWSPPVIAGGTITGYRVSRDGGAAGASGWSTTVSATTRSLNFTNLILSRTYMLSVAAINSHGTGPSATTSVTPGTPGLPTKVAVKATSPSSAAMTWGTPPTPGSSAITGYRVTRDGGSPDGTGWSAVVPASTRSYTFTKLAYQTFTFTVAALNAKGAGSAQTVRKSLPNGPPDYAPDIGIAVAGVSGGAITATPTWTYPGGTFKGEVTGYQVQALRMSSTGAVLSTTTSAVQPVTATSLAMTLPQTGNYRFSVQAINDLGAGPQSAQSNLVAGR